MSEQTPRIVVIGGGYAGVLAANRLRRRPGLDITLVNPRPQFVERIRLHQLVVGNDDATERGIVADQLRQITVLRVEGLLAS